MKRIISQPLLDRLFRIAITVKGLLGFIDISGGIALLVVPVYRLHGWLESATYELAQDRHAFIAHSLWELDRHLTPGLALFAALYLLGHGVIKIALAIALLRRHYKVYPFAMSFLLLFIFYQSYLIGYNHSAELAVLTGFDGLVTWLIYLEWRRHTPPPLPAPAQPPSVGVFRSWRRLVFFGIICGALVTSGVAVAMAWPEATQDSLVGPVAPHLLGPALADLKHKISDFEGKQAAGHIELQSPQTLQDHLTQIEAEVRQRQYNKASRDIHDLKASLAGWTNQLGAVNRESVQGTPAPAASGEWFVPIILYHYTPTNFEQQLVHLEQHGYTTVDLSQVAAAMSGKGSLPAKPVVITYDDGFANQMTAFNILKAHHMKATFYIINGGEASKWCIGAGRRYHDPLQPPQGCGDAYLTWDQVRELDRSGLVTIGGHTLDHPNLAILPPEQQRHEIIDSKQQIEQEIGHPISDFAYPYGNYNATTIEITKEAGYTTAVTVMPGDHQSPGQVYTLRRIRDTLTLP